MGWMGEMAARIAGRLVIDHVGHELNELSETLRAGDPAGRALAVQRLENVPGPDAMALLVGATSDADPEVRAAAVRALGPRRESSTLPALGILVSDADPRVRTAAIDALVEIGAPRRVPPKAVSPSDPRAATLVGRVATDSDESVRTKALAALPALGARGVELATEIVAELPSERVPQARRALRDALGAAMRSPEAAHRRAAVRAASAWSGEAPLDALLDAVADEDDGVRAAAIETVAALAPTDAFDVLLERTDDPNEDAACEAIEGLAAAQARGALGDSDREALQEKLSTLARHREGRRQERATWALGTLGRIAQVPVLCDLLRTEGDELPRVAAEALGRLRDPRATQPLMTALRSGGPRTRAASAAALGAIADPRGLVELVRALFTECDPAVVAAIDAALDASCGNVEAERREALTHADSAQRVPALRAAAGDPRLARLVLASLLDAPDAPCRRAAIEALELLGLDPTHLSQSSAWLPDQPEARRLVAIQGLIVLEAPEREHHFSRLLADPNETPTTWAACVKGLALTGDAGRQQLERHRAHAHEGVRASVQAALGGAA